MTGEAGSSEGNIQLYGHFFLVISLLRSSMETFTVLFYSYPMCIAALTLCTLFIVGLMLMIRIEGLLTTETQPR